ncbi:MAG: translocation/assembly module TamB domain-containing protein [Bacteroidales bacterium]
MKKVLKYSIRSLLWLLLTAIILILLVAAVIQIKPVKQKIGHIAGEKVSEMINGEFKIKEIEGNFFSELELRDISLKQGSDTVLFLENIKVRYNLVPLLSGRVQVYYLGLKKPGLWFEQLNDSTWNFNQILKPTEKEQEKKEGGSLNLDLDTLKIIDGDIEISSPDTIIPGRIQNLNFAASFHMEEEDLSFTLSRFSFITKEPDFLVENISFIVNKDEKLIQLSDLYIKTSENRIDGRGDYLGPDPITADASLSTSPVKSDEFEFFLGSLKIPATPVFQFNTDINRDSLNLFLGLNEGDQEVLIYAVSPNFGSFINQETDEPLDYIINTELKNIDMSTWVGDPSLKYSITGNMDITGSGVDPESSRISVEARFNDCLIQERPVDSILLSADLDNGDINAVLKGMGNFGDFSLNTEMLGIFENPKYSLELITNKLNIAPLTGVDTLDSDLNLKLQANGEGFDPEEINAAANLVVSETYLQDIKLDTIVGRFQYENENLVVQEFDMRLHDLMLNLEGNFNLNGYSDILLKAEFKSLSDFAYYIPVTEVNSEGNINARIYGEIDSLNLDTEISLSSVNVQGNTAESLRLNGVASVTKSDTLANFEISADNLNAGNYKIESVFADIKANPKEIIVNSEINAEELNTDLTAKMLPGKATTSVIIDAWKINFREEEWSLQQPPARIEFDSVSYSIDNFYLATAQSDTSQFIKIDGELSRAGQENLNLELAHLPVEQILKLTGNETNASGLIYMDLKLTGTAGSPLMDGNFRIDRAKFNDNPFSEFSADFSFENNILHTNTSIIHSDTSKVKLSAGVPFSAALDSMSFELLKDEEISGRLEIRKFPIAILQTLDQVEELTGYLDGQADIGGTLNSLSPEGNLNLKEASLKLPQYGIDYNEMSLNLSLAKHAATLDSILVRSEDGKLTGYGKMTFSSEIYKGDLSETQIDIQFDNFNPVNHPQFNMQLMGDVGIKGEEKNLVFNGDISIPEAEVFIPAVMNMMGEPTVADLPEPILLQEMPKDSIRIDTLRYLARDTLKTDTTGTDYFENIVGSVKVNIPRNVWIKNKDMYVEIKGDVEIIKNPEFFEVFGSMNVVRGQYNLLGRTFIINKGIISFQGGEELIPNLDIEASYTFRNSERVEQTLKVFVTGDIEQPKVNFRLDGNSITEGDALSYIMFGKSANELGMDQQENLAGKAAANLISSQISGYLSEKLDVDYIQVNADEGFDNATVVVGKYITNDLFVSYEQRLGETDEQEISNYEVRLEYELFRFLFIELNNSSRESGFDLIFKKDFLE